MLYEEVSGGTFSRFAGSAERLTGSQPSGRPVADDASFLSGPAPAVSVPRAGVDVVLFLLLGM